MTGFGWLDDLVRGLLQLVPRPLLVKATHAGVMFTRSRARRIGPGLHWYWPVWSEALTYPVKRQSLNLPPQTLLLKDGETVVVSVAVVYDIDDVYRALVETYELLDTIRDVAQAAVKQVLLGKTLAALRDEQQGLDTELTRRARSLLHPYGIRVIRAYVTDLAKTRVYRVFGATPPSD
jgi:regulator of protease activity HflC (stomatin/prohibitin superfamily)